MPLDSSEARKAARLATYSGPSHSERMPIFGLFQIGFAFIVCAGHVTGRHRCVDHTGADAVDADVVARVLAEYHLGQHDERALAHAVSRMSLL